jgi:hypothetical protein
LNPRARQRDNGTIRRDTGNDGILRPVSERTWNAAALTGQDPSLAPGSPVLSGTPGGTGFYSSYQGLLDTLRNPGIVNPGGRGAAAPPNPPNFPPPPTLPANPGPPGGLANPFA